ncbi:MAG TPA: hypothetical protein VH853_05430 [Polyangia bacterium]|nr:hypothetical protein [Polyangia bacterium]
MTAAALTLELTLEQGRTAFEPGARVAGVAVWSTPIPPRGMELRLSWAIHGRGGRDYKIADSIALPDPAAAERRAFFLTLPPAPYSFRGKMLTLVWSLELVALPGEEKARVDLVVAPGGKIIELR